MGTGTAPARRHQVNFVREPPTILVPCGTQHFSRQQLPPERNLFQILLWLLTAPHLRNELDTCARCRDMWHVVRVVFIRGCR